MNVDFTNTNEEDTNVNHFDLNHPPCLDELQFDLNYPPSLDDDHTSQSLACFNEGEVNCEPNQSPSLSLEGEVNCESNQSPSLSLQEDAYHIDLLLNGDEG
jgi:hypothetical protein